MRYLVKARVKPGCEKSLIKAIEGGTLGKGSIAGDEYLYDMEQARVGQDGTAHWVETCFCPTPLQEERPYWEKYFELVSVKDAHNRNNCRDWNGTEPWACSNCDCTKRLEEHLRKRGEPFLEKLKNKSSLANTGHAGGGFAGMSEDFHLRSTVRKISSVFRLNTLTNE